MAGAAFYSSKKKTPSPVLGRNSGVAHLDRPSLPKNGRPRRSTGSSKSARMSCNGIARFPASSRTIADLPMPGPPQRKTGCLAATKVRSALDIADAFIGLSFFEGCLGVNGGATHVQVSGSLRNIGCAVQDYDVASLCGMGKCEPRDRRTIRVIVGKWA